jgi:hypothetical protein
MEKSSTWINKVVISKSNAQTIYKVVVDNGNNVDVQLVKGSTSIKHIYVGQSKTMFLLYNGITRLFYDIKER